MDSASAIIDSKGGPAKFGRAIGRKPGSVRIWKHRDYFPRTAWPEIQTAFPDLTLEKLKELEAIAEARP